MICAQCGRPATYSYHWRNSYDEAGLCDMHADILLDAADPDTYYIHRLDGKAI